MMSPADLDRVRGLMDELETLDAVNRDLMALNDGLGNLSAHPADVAVALLSLLPSVGRDARALDFISDAITANAASLQQVIGLQATLTRIAGALDGRLEQLRDAVANLRVPS